MSRRAWMPFGIVAAMSLVLAGCQQTGDDGDDIEINGLRLTEAEASPEAKTKRPARDKNAEETAAAETSDVELTAAKQPPKAAQLSFTLQPGDRFPLQKTIEQTLAQNTPQGPVRSRSKLTMMFAITVEKEEAGRRLLNVRYQRVRYTHDLLGEKVDYDSKQKDSFVPDAALLYRGMVDNGFSFWLAQDNRMSEVVDFQGFLKRCVQSIPKHKQQAVLAQVASNPDDEGFANFVDDSIGLLRFNPDAPGRETDVKEGEEWMRTRKLLHPLPMAINSTYTLSKVTDTLATIEIFGTIVPMRVAQLAQPSQKLSEAEIILKDGHTHGRSVIDRASGLPIHSQVTRNLALRVRMPDKTEFDQNKQIITTVEAFPASKPIYTGENEHADASTTRQVNASGNAARKQNVIPLKTLPDPE